MSHLWTLLTHAYSLAGPVLMLLYPLYASVMTIESSKTGDDDKSKAKKERGDDQWLAYWILYSFLTLLEMLLVRLLERIPIWYDLKLILIAWLVLPPFNGAAFLYDTFVGKPLRKRHPKPSSPNGKSSKK